MFMSQHTSPIGGRLDHYEGRVVCIRRRGSDTRPQRIRPIRGPVRGHDGNLYTDLDELEAANERYRRLLAYQPGDEKVVLWKEGTHQAM